MKHLVRTSNIGDVNKADFEKVVFDDVDDKTYLYGLDNDFVDLGLPSGTIWATRNIGATNPLDIGWYFQWADTHGYPASQVGTGRGQKAFCSDGSDSKYGKQVVSSARYSKYVTSTTAGQPDGLTSLMIQDDMAASGHPSVKWRVPSDEQYRELFNYCTLSLLMWDGTECTVADGTMDTENGLCEWNDATSLESPTNPVACMKVTSQGKSIYFPVTGMASNGHVEGETSGAYVTSCISTPSGGSEVTILHFSSAMAMLTGSNRTMGYPVRGVFMRPTVTV